MPSDDESPDTLLEQFRKAGDVPNLPLPENWNPQYPLQPFQKVGAAHLLVKRRFILGDPTGSGKSPQELYAWAGIRQARVKQGTISRLWVVTTKSATKQWEDEVKKFLLGVQVYRVKTQESKEKRVRTVKAWLEDKKGGVLISNWAQFRLDWPEIQKETKVEIWLPQTQIVADEAQKIKNPESSIGKVAREIFEKADRVHGLTATLVRNQAHDAQAVVETICPGTMSRQVFELLFCKKVAKKIGKQKWANEIVSYHHLEDFAKRISHVYLGRSDEEIEGQRPEVCFMNRTVVMSPAQRRVYTEAEQGMLLEDPDTVGAPIIIHAQQAANNPEIWYDQETPLTTRTKENAKADLLLEMLEDELAGEPIIIYSHLETTISAYQKRLEKYNPVRVTGKEVDDEREKARLAFQEGRTNIILITDAGGEALNLQRAKHVIMLSRPWAPGPYVQVVGRARRFGSKHASVTIWHLTCEDTIDEYIDALLSEKFGAVEDIVRGRGNLVPQDQVLPKDIALYARKKRMKSGERRFGVL
jgi:SNF2 family DNA or RNA helicase